MILEPRKVENCLPLIFEGRAYLFQNGTLYWIERAEIVEDYDSCEFYVRCAVCYPRHILFARRRLEYPEEENLSFGETVWILKPES